jgi:hypothetical protein
MKTAKTLANLTVLALTLGSVPVARAQQGTQTQKPAAKASKAVKPAKAHKGAVSTSAPEQGAAPAPETPELIVSRRDPFTPLVSVPHGGGGPEHLPPGKAGLVVATVRVDGAVKSPNGMIAVVSNQDQRVYFVREGDRLYDGNVEKISLDGVTFRENSKDAFGRSVERLVTKRIYSSAGEQQ